MQQVSTKTKQVNFFW